MKDKADTTFYGTTSKAERGYTHAQKDVSAPQMYGVPKWTHGGRCSPTCWLRGAWLVMHQVMVSGVCLTSGIGGTDAGAQSAAKPPPPYPLPSPPPQVRQTAEDAKVKGGDVVAGGDRTVHKAGVKGSRVAERVPEKVRVPASLLASTCSTTAPAAPPAAAHAPAALLAASCLISLLTHA